MSVPADTPTPPAWTSASPASDDTVATLIQQSPWPLPPDYIAYLRSSNGGEGDVGLQPGYLILWPALEVLVNHAEYQVPEYAPGFLAFGSSGGGELFAFDMREEHKTPVVILPCIGLDPSEAWAVAESFGELAVHFGQPCPASD